ncbi:MAG: metallophosphoesterase [Syntrophomonadaceae bacterium]|nr:metallophosphoesterase [Syntrophomonadaceae bacterium]
MRSYFFVIMGAIILANLLWFFLSERWLRQDLKNYPNIRQLARILLFVWATLIAVPLIIMVIPGTDFSFKSIPWLWHTIFYFWICAIFVLMLVMSVLGIPLWAVIKVFDKRKNKIPPVKSENSDTSGLKPSFNKSNAGLTRRQFVRLATVAAPPLLVSVSSLAAWSNSQDLKVYSLDLPVKDLPEGLEGFTITHLSDIHIGMVTGRERVDKIVAAANGLKSDIIVITGDILDRELTFLPDLVDTVGALYAPMGTYLCIGNHDKIFDANNFIETVRKADLNLLLNEAVMLDTGNVPIKLLGVDYSRQEIYYEAFIRRADQTVSSPSNALKILLAHHPHSFDYIMDQNVSIVLAGHTHGGQIVVQAGEEWEIFNPGRHLFRYVRGIYKNANGNVMFVHQGSGDWFPLRLGSACEVVQLRLTREA